MLKCTTKTIVQVNYSDLDAYVDEVFGLKRGEVEFAPLHEANNDSSYSFNVNINHILKEETEEIEEWIARGHKGYFPGYSNLLEYMAQHGHIEPGEYIVKVSW